MFIDTHAHLNFNEFDNDYQAVIDRATKAGVSKIIIPSSDPDNARTAVELADKYPNIFPAIGAHPLNIISGFSLMIDDGFDPTLLMESYNGAYSHRCTLKYFKEMAAYHKVKAIGEIGLDYNCDGKSVNKDVQKAALKAIINTTIDLNKPYIFHCRPEQGNGLAISDLYKILAGFFKGKKGLSGVIHCYAGDFSWQQRFYKLGFLVSYTGLITLTDKYDQDIAKIPLDQMLLETDCPFLAPKSHQGQRSEPIHVIEVAKKIAQIKKVSKEEVGKITTKKAEELFKI